MVSQYLPLPPTNHTKYIVVLLELQVKFNIPPLPPIGELEFILTLHPLLYDVDPDIK